MFRSSNRGTTWSAADVPLVKDNALVGRVLAGIRWTGARRDRRRRLPARRAERRLWPTATTAASPGRHLPSSGSSPISPRWRLIQPIGVIFWQWAAHTPPTLTMWEAESGKAYWDLNFNAAAFVGPGEAIAVGPQGKIVRFTLP